ETGHTIDLHHIGDMTLCRYVPGEPGQQVMPNDTRQTIIEALRESRSYIDTDYDYEDGEQERAAHIDATLAWLQDAQPSEQERTGDIADLATEVIKEKAGATADEC